MTPAEILTLYDRQMRKACEGSVSFTVESLPTVTRLIGKGVAAGSGVVIYSQLNESTAEQVVNETIQYFRKQGMWFEWKLFAHDPPADLGALLEARGLMPGVKEALLVLDLSRPPTFPFPERIQILQATGPEELAWINELNLANEGRDAEELVAELTEELRETPEKLSVYFAMDNGMPVSVGWVRFHPGKNFAELWGGQTLKGYRNKGIYKALVSLRASEARSRGASFLTVDARPMSRPILEGMGFQLLTFTTPHLWQPI